MSNTNTNIGSSLLKFTFTDEDGECLASFHINPADIKLGQRCQEVAAFFKSFQAEIPANATMEDAIKLNDLMEDKICYLLGYDAKQSLFGLVSATAIMVDGNMFAYHVLNKITEALGPELKKRQQRVKKAMAKYTEKYEK